MQLNSLRTKNNLVFPFPPLTRYSRHMKTHPRVKRNIKAIFIRKKLLGEVLPGKFMLLSAHLCGAHIVNGDNF